MATFTPRGWRLVRFGSASGARLGAIDPAAPQVVRELRERDPIAALRRGLAAAAAEAVGEHVADDAATLAGLPLLALFRSVRGGHKLNHAVLTALLADRSAWRVVEAERARRPRVADAVGGMVGGMVAPAYGPDVS